MERADFLRPKGNHKNLIAFQKAECIYDMTCYFVSHYLPAIGDRTVDQMKQAARSGKQNIAEGNEACTTSMESGIKLINVAKASLKELQEDYEDYLREHRLPLWGQASERYSAARDWCKTRNHPQEYMRVCENRDAETIANICLILIHQTDYLLKKLIDKLKADFLENGGAREQMFKARKEYRGEKNK